MSDESSESFVFFKHGIPALYENVENLLFVMGAPREEMRPLLDQNGHPMIDSDTGEPVMEQVTVSETWAQGYPLAVRHENGDIEGDHLTEGHGPLALMHVGLVVLILVALGLTAFYKVKDTQAAIVPDAKLSPRTIVEVLVGTAYGMMKDIMGQKAARFFLPLIGTCAFFILFSNSLGLIPGFLPPTSSLSVTLACALVIFFTTHIFGVKEHGIAYFKHFLGPIIKWYALPLMILFLVVELISHIVRPISLGVRLMANMFADHAVLAIFMTLVPLLVPVPVLLLGSLVVVVQALVFCILSTVYISMAIEHSEDH
jgi:F-type H+-transporting ATPase subunit a